LDFQIRTEGPELGHYRVSGKLGGSKCCPVCPRNQTFDLRVDEYTAEVTVSAQRDEVAPDHSITSSARSKSEAGVDRLGDLENPANL
jgi:hypothetical protein